MPEDASGYREQDGCWNCAAIADCADYDDAGEWRCMDERRQKSKRHNCPKVAPGGICRYYRKEGL